MHAIASTMQTYTGVCRSPNSRPVAGRIVFAEEEPIFQKGSCLMVVRSLRDCIRLESNSLAGIIQVGAPEPPFQAIADLSCPHLILSDLPADAHGKIALLDPSHGALFVSPDIEVFNRLMHRLTPPSRSDVKPSLTLPNGKAIRLGTILSSESCFPSIETESALFSPPSAFEEEDTLYERYRDFAESSIGTPLTVTVSCPRVQADRSILRRQLRALFRSAVFGNFSILIQGILAPGDQKIILNEILAATDELTWEKREFNSAIPMGVLLDSPLLLYENRTSEAKFSCLDLDRLWDLTTGYSSRTDKEIYRAFALSLRDSLLKQCLPCTSVIANRVSSLWAISSLWNEWEISDCFVPLTLRSDAYDALSPILSKKEQI